MKKLTDEQKEAYLKDNLKCPHCRSEQIEGGPTMVEGNEAWQKMGCNECQKSWQDIYTLSDIEDID